MFTHMGDLNYINGAVGVSDVRAIEVSIVKDWHDSAFASGDITEMGADTAAPADPDDAVITSILLEKQQQAHKQLHL